MQIRKRGKRLEFLRSVYDPKSKRCRQKMIGSIESSGHILPDSLRAEMTPAELTQAEACLAERQADLTQVIALRALDEAEDNLSLLAMALELEEPVPLPKAKVIYQGMDRIARRLRAQGFKKKQVERANPEESQSSSPDPAPDFG